MSTLAPASSGRPAGGLRLTRRWAVDRLAALRWA
jgi:hypothetical protein